MMAIKSIVRVIAIGTLILASVSFTPRAAMAGACPCKVMGGVANALVAMVHEAFGAMMSALFQSFMSDNVDKAAIPGGASGAAGAASASGAVAAASTASDADAGQAVAEATEAERAAADALAAVTPSDALADKAAALIGLPQAAQNVEHARLALGNFDTNYHVGVGGPGQPTLQAADGSQQSTEQWLLGRIYPYCQKASYGGTLQNFCQNETVPGSDDYIPDVTDYSQFIDQRATLKLLGDDGQPLDPDAADNDLGRVVTFKRLVVSTPPLSRATSQLVAAGNFQEAYLRMRAAAAKRSVIENSLNTIIAMKTEGSAEARAQIAAAIEEAGLEVPDSLGDKPSYDAQMEVLTRTLYQSQQFFNGMINHEADLQRQLIFMNGIQLIQDRDTAKSAKRIEMLLSQLLESELSSYKNQILRQ